MTLYQHKISTAELSRWLDLPRSVYYYRPKPGRPGCRPSASTLMDDGQSVSNEQVVDKIKSILMGEFVCYGYETTCHALKQQGYKINKKKVYRLMSDNNLLLGKVIKTSGKRKFVKHRKITASGPLEYLCLDIKFVWIPSESRHYYLLTLLDVYSRMVLAWVFQKNIRKKDVINMFGKIDAEHGIKGVNIRNDNGSQFIANEVKLFLSMAGANQEFTHIATPQENAYIEAFHSILEREVIDRFEFSDFVDAKLTFEAYMQFYNHQRLHRAIGFITPAKKWAQSKPFLLVRPTESTAGICRNTDKENNQNISNLLNTSVQLLGG